MLARLAGNLFWLSRYLERVEGTARLINSHDSLLMDLPRADPRHAWAPLISITGLDELFYSQFNEPSQNNVCHFLIADKRNPSSIVSSLDAARDNLRSSRDIMSRSLYEAINNLCLMVRAQVTTGIDAANRQRFLGKVEHQLLAITGCMEGSMSNDMGYLFLRMGCFLERADMTSRLLDVRSANLLPASDESPLLAFENLQWMSVLRSVSGMQMYLTHVRQPVNGPDVLRYLLQDENLPRAYQCCLRRLDLCVKRLGGNHLPMRRLRRLEREVANADIIGLASNKPQLHDFIDALQIKLARVGDGLAERYFPD